MLSTVLFFLISIVFPPTNGRLTQYYINCVYFSIHVNAFLKKVFIIQAKIVFVHIIEGLI